MLLLAFLYSLLVLPCAVLAAWGYRDDGSNYVIDSGANLVVKVSKSTGDITSLQFRGVEYNGYGGKNSHVESGLGPSTVSIQQFSTPGNVIKVTVQHGTLLHYIVVRYKNDNVYLLTNKADASIRVQRYIVRFPAGLFPMGKDAAHSDYYQPQCTAIETADICATSDGQTWSKHYQGNNYGRTIDYDYVGVNNGKVGMYMIRSNHEKASGGPFFRSLVRRGATDGNDLYDIYFYNMGHTDPERFGLQGPSVLAFTDGQAPNANLFARKADWGWFDSLGIAGWVPAGGRGTVAGVGLANMKSGYAYTVGLSNAAAQYWTPAAAGSGAWSVAGVLPGTYTVTVYKGELGVATGTATVGAGGKAALNTLTCVDPSDTTALWRIGEWDGTPGGLRNFETAPYKPTYMHPSDSRLASWDPPNFIVGTTRATDFPAYMWQDVNNGHVVYFRLTAAQLATGRTVRIGITQAYIGARPQIRVNGWTSSVPAASNQAKTRSLTVGTYRGNNVVFTYAVPASAWVQSATEYQVLTISVVTGSTGTGFLSGGIAIDCVDLV